MKIQNLVKLFTLTLLSINLHSNCNTSDFLKDDTFLHDFKEIKMFNNDTREFEDTISKSVSKNIKNCTLNKRKLIYYSFRNNIKEFVLIQFIFDTNENSKSFFHFADVFVNTELINKYVDNLEDFGKPIVIEIKTSRTHLEKAYEFHPYEKHTVKWIHK